MRCTIREEDDKNHTIIYLPFTDLCASRKSVHAQEVFEITLLTLTPEELKMDSIEELA